MCSFNYSNKSFKRKKKDNTGTEERETGMLTVSQMCSADMNRDVVIAWNVFHQKAVDTPSEKMHLSTSFFVV